MSPAAFMAHRITQRAMMNLTASDRIHHPDAKLENEGTRLNSYYYAFRGSQCLRSFCTCPASVSGVLGQGTGDGGAGGPEAVLRDIGGG